jgi:DNA (cytosine-5)-methyltransferase 1
MGKPKVISLYSGAGGLDYGFEAAGFDTAVAVEMNKDSCATLRANRGWPVIERDILKVPSAEIMEVARVKKGEAEVLIGGPPCQPFSKAGYWSKGDSLRLDDPRAATLSAYLRVLQDTTPAAFLLENVEGLAYRGKDEGLKLLLDAIEVINKKTKSNYQPRFQVLNAADYGVPQIRKRVLMIAARDGTEFRFPEPTHRDPSLQNDLFGDRQPYRTAWDALADVGPEKGEAVELTGRWADLLASIPEGHNYLWHTDRMGGLPLFGWRRRYWSFLLKLAKSLPSWTVQAQPGPAIGPFHWQNRKLSMRELCRIQTFPDDVKITGSRTEIQRQVGNAVPSLLGEVIAGAIKSQLLGLRASRDPLRLIPPVRLPIPAPERLRPVPKRFKEMVGEHSAHPGTGKGTRALVRYVLVDSTTRRNLARVAGDPTRSGAPPRDRV